MSTQMDTPPAAPPSWSPPPTARRLRGHPFALVPIVGMAMWDLMSFFAIQSLLIFYLKDSPEKGGMGIDPIVAVGIVTSNVGLGFLSGIAVAWIADRLLSPERTLFYSAVLVMLGHLALSLVPGIPGLVLGLIGIGVGSGGVKALGVTVVGTFYAPTDIARLTGFHMFYLGLNIGAFLGPLLSGVVKVSWGYHAAFIVAGVCMLAGLIFYQTQRHHVVTEANRRVRRPLPREQWWKPALAVAGFTAVVLALFASGWLSAATLPRWSGAFGIALAIIYFSIIIGSRRTAPNERRRMIAYLPLWISSVVFWSVFTQLFGIFQLYAESRVNRVVGDVEIPTSMLMSMPPLWTMLLAVGLAWFWERKLGDRQPIAGHKFALALTILGLGFLGFTLMERITQGGQAGKVPLLVLIALFGFFSLAELLITPVGMALVTALSPRAFTSQTVSVFFVSPAIGFGINGMVSPLYQTMPKADYFMLFGLIVVGTALIIAVLAKRLSREYEGVK